MSTIITSVTLLVALCVGLCVMWSVGTWWLGCVGVLSGGLNERGHHNSASIVLLAGFFGPFAVLLWLLA